MIRSLFTIAICVCAFAIINQADSAEAQQQQYQQQYQQQPMPQQQSRQQPAYGAQWGQQGSQNMNRFYHYPYVTYPQNYVNNHYARSSDSLYHRYPAEMRTPVYNKAWHNYYPTSRRYHFGHHFLTDVF